MNGFRVLLWMILVSLPGWLAQPAFAASAASFYDLAGEGINGKKVSLSEFRGNVTLVVNTASRCGFTSQYKELQEIYDRYKSKGFVVIGFPSNDFAGQEPGSNAEIKKFCDLNYKIRFPMMAKGKVIGSGKQPAYEFLTRNAPVKGEVSWNFEKFLIARDGRVAGRFDPATSPLDQKLVTKVEALLADKKQK